MTTHAQNDIGPYWLVMGVSGTGKTSVGRALAQRLGGVFVEGDDFHPRRNIDRMRQGQPLTDDDRWPWLAAVAEAGRRERERTGQPVFIAASALKRSYRDFLRERLPGLRVLFLKGSQEVLAQRLGYRRGHFMPPALLQSQLRDLEPPQGEAGVRTVSVAPPLDQVLAESLLQVTGH